MPRKKSIKSYAQRLAIIVGSRRIRLLLKQARTKGELIGMDRLRREYDDRELDLREQHEAYLGDDRARHQHRMKLYQAMYQEDIKQLKEGFETKLETLKADFDAERQELKGANKVEIAGYHDNFKERCDRNDELREDAVKQCDAAKDGARKAEAYWREQIGKINEFLAASVGVVKTLGDRYEFLQNSMSKVQVGKDMIEDLDKAYRNLVKNAHKDAPPILGENNFNNKK